MDLRFIPAALLLLATGVIAQGVTPPVKPVTNIPKASVPQEQAKPQERSSGDIITELQKEKERLQREIEYAQNRAKNANRFLAEKLGKRGQTFASIDAGINRPARPATVPMKKARMMTPAELGKHGDDTMLVIAGLAIRQNQFDTLMNYLRSLSNTGEDSMRAQRVLFELIRVNSVAATFPENSAEGQISEVYGQLQSGKTMAEVGKTFGQVLGAKEDGTVEVTRNSFLGVNLERVAFSLKEGEYSRPFRNVFGFVVIGVDKIEKGATPELDKITARTVQIRYSADDATLNLAQAAASRGQVDILVRDDKVLAMLPAMYRPTPARGVGESVAFDNMRKTLSTLEDKIRQIEASATDTTKGDLDALKQQRDKIKALLEQAKQRETSDADSSDSKPGQKRGAKKLDADQADADKPGKKPIPVKPGGKKKKKGSDKKQLLTPQ